MRTGWLESLIPSDSHGQRYAGCDSIFYKKNFAGEVTRSAFFVVAAGLDGV